MNSLKQIPAPSRGTPYSALSQSTQPILQIDRCTSFLPLEGIRAILLIARWRLLTLVSRPTRAAGVVPVKREMDDG
jgi:hypothetical protein